MWQANDSQTTHAMKKNAYRKKRNRFHCYRYDTCNISGTFPHISSSISTACIRTCIYRVGEKTWHLTFVHMFANYWPIFKILFTGTLCGQFAITQLLHIPPHRKCVFTLLCEISMKYTYITIITNKHFSKFFFKKPLQTNIAVNSLYDSRLCGSSTV